MPSQKLRPVQKSAPGLKHVYGILAHTISIMHSSYSISFKVVQSKHAFCIPENCGHHILSRSGFSGDESIRESPLQFENRIMARVYVRSITRSSYQKAPFC